MQCRYCKWSDDAHAPGCPCVAVTQPDKLMALSQWNRGYSDGRGGKSEAADKNETYDMGYSAGVCAIEEAENGFDSVYEGRQW